MSLERDYYYKFFLLKWIIIEIFFTRNELLILEMDYIWKNMSLERDYYYKFFLLKGIISGNICLLK